MTQRGLIQLFSKAWYVVPQGRERRFTERYWCFRIPFDKDFPGGVMPPIFYDSTRSSSSVIVLIGGLARRRSVATPGSPPCHARRVSCMFGLLSGQSGLGWISPLHIESAQLFVDLGAGAHPLRTGFTSSRAHRAYRLRAESPVRPGSTGRADSPAWAMFAFAAFTGRLFGAGDALFASALCCLPPRPAITIATCSDVGAKGETFRAALHAWSRINGCLAFTVIAVAHDALPRHHHRFRPAC